MPGFFISQGKIVPSLKNYDDSRCVQGEFKSCGWNIQWNVLDKFFNDKLFFENEEYIMVLDGIILNKRDLQNKYHETNWQNLLIQLVSKDQLFFKELRGAFCGAYYDKKSKRWIAFTDQTGNHLLLYFCDNDSFVISSQLNYVSDWMKLNHKRRILSYSWVNDFLSYGYMLDTHTIIENCNRLFPGDYLIYDENSRILSIKEYYRAIKTELDLPEEEIIEKLDCVFTEAVKRVVEKCSEYDYKLLVDVSGGLDSRMIAAVTHKLGYEDILLGINYAQSESYDQKIAKNVASKCSIEMLQLYLDSGKCVCDIDDLIFMNQGMNYYIGITGGKFVLENVDRHTYGAELWGILGDIYEGAMITEDNLSELCWDYPRFRTCLHYPVFNKTGYERLYQDNEMMWFYIRGMIAGQNTAFIRQNFVEAPAVYGDVDFMNFNFSIPYEVRTKGHIYRKWMKLKYQEMSDIIYSHNGVKVCTDDTEEKILALPNKIKNKINRKLFKNSYEKSSSMNPIGYWIKNNKDISSYIDNYYSENIAFLSAWPEIKAMVSELFNSDDPMGKIVSLSMISAIKQYIS